MDFIKERNDAFQLRRDTALEKLNAVDGIRCRRPQGAFYLFPSCDGLIGRATPEGKVLQNDVDLRACCSSARHRVRHRWSLPDFVCYVRRALALGCDRISQACELLT
jgi:aspartate aminotransferase